MGLFGKRPDPKTQVREWSSKLRAEQNKIERQINQIKREEEKVAASLKQAAKKGDKESCRVLAKEVVGARKSVTKMYSSKVGAMPAVKFLKGATEELFVKTTYYKKLGLGSLGLGPWDPSMALHF